MMKNLVLTLLGFLLLGLGALGVVVPVLPTTPFVLLSAFCFSMGNKKAHAWLRRSRVFGPYIEHYRTKRGISLPLKVGSIAFLWAGLAGSTFVVQAVWLYFLLGAVGMGVTIHLLLIKTRKD